MAGLLKLKKQIDWTDEEVYILCEFYGKEPIDKTLKRFKNRTRVSIMRKAKKIGITHKKYSNNEIEILKKYYKNESIKEIKTRLPNRTVKSIKDMAGRLELTTKRKKRT